MPLTFGEKQREGSLDFGEPLLSCPMRQLGSTFREPEQQIEDNDLRQQSDTF